MPARQSFYAESLGESTTTSASAQTKLTLNFTPDASSDYFIFVSAIYTNSSTTDDHVGKVDLQCTTPGTLLVESGQVKEPTSPQDWLPFFGIARASFGASPSAQDVIIRYWSSHSGDTTKIKDARVLVLKADAADKYAASDDLSSTTSTGTNIKTTLTFTPATSGDYLVIAFAVLGMDANTTGQQTWLDHVTGGQTYGARKWYCKDDYDGQPFCVAEKLTLPASSQTFQLDYASDSGTLSYIQYARILALRLDKFEASYFASNQAVQNTTSATNTDFLTLTQTPAAVSHAIIAVGAWNNTSGSVSAYLNIAQDGSNLTELVREGPWGSAYLYAGLVQRLTLPASSTTWKWRARAETAGTTVNIANLAIAVLQLDATAAPRRRQMKVIV
jgi:hypothetical protein